MLKRVCLIVLSVVSVSCVAFAGGSKSELVMDVTCDCNQVNSDGIMIDTVGNGLISPTMEGKVNAAVMNPSLSSVDSCQTDESGKVISGCEKVISNADAKCNADAQDRLGELSSGSVDRASCYMKLEVRITDVDSEEDRTVTIK